MYRDHEIEPPSLTKRQVAIVRAVTESIEKSGYPPTMREIGALVGLSSTSSVKHQLEVLEKKGALRRDPHLPRALEILVEPDPVTGEIRWATDSCAEPQTLQTEADPINDSTAGQVIEGDFMVSESAVNVPLVGQIAAGNPILAQQAPEDLLPLPANLVGGGDLFALTVRGDSMIEAAICDGDIVVVRQQNNAENGEIVAALLDEEATVKTLQKREGKVWLLPQNPAYEPIDGTRCTILGKVVTVMRSL